MLPDNLSHLAAFSAVARHSSFRRAGEELGLSTSAVSYAIRSLEAVSYTHLTLPTKA